MDPVELKPGDRMVAYPCREFEGEMYVLAADLQQAFSDHGNDTILLKDQVRQLQDLTDRQAETIHSLKHDAKVILEGFRSRVDFIRSRLAQAELLTNELISALGKELTGV